MGLYIIEPTTRAAGGIVVCDAEHNDVAEFFHNEHATVSQTYETAMAHAQQLVDCTVERDRLARLVEGMINQAPQSIYGKPNVRMALAIAASNVRRGRYLTTREELMNLAAGMEEPIDGDSPEDIAAAKDLADRIRKAAETA